MMYIFKYFVLVFFFIISTFNTNYSQSRYSLDVGLHTGIVPMGSTPSFKQLSISTGIHGVVSYQYNNKITLQSGLFFSGQHLSFLNVIDFDKEPLVRLSVPVIFTYKLVQMKKWTVASDIGLEWNNSLTKYDFDEKFLPLPESAHVKLLSSNVEDPTYHFNFGGRIGFNIIRNLNSNNKIKFFCHYIIPLRNTQFLYYQITRFPSSTEFFTTRNYLNLSFHGIQLGASYMFQMKEERDISENN